MSFFLRSSLLFAVAALGLACGDDHTQGERDNARDSRTRAVTVSAIGNGQSTIVTASLVDERGLPSTLPPDEYFFARIADDDFVLVRELDANGNAIYRATLPPMLAYFDVALNLVHPGYPSGTSVANIRVDSPFEIDTAPAEVRVGEELRVEFAPSTTSPGGRPLITLDGPCLPKLLPAPLQTYGSFSEARFATTNLPVSGGGCDVVVTIMTVEEQSGPFSGFDGTHSKAQGIQQRSLVVHLSM